MSSILKALKKVEKDQNIAKPKTLAAVSNTSSDSQRNSSTKLLISGLTLFALGGGFVYYLTTLSSKKPVVYSNASEPAKNALSQRKEPEEPATPKAVSTVTVQPQKDSTTLFDTKVSQPQPTARQVQTSKHQRTDNNVPVPSKSGKAAITSGSAQTATELSLEVNGIAYQGENGDSIAVVNGVSVSKRSVIEGVTVQEIHQDRVTFNRGGKIFDVELGKTGR